MAADRAASWGVLVAAGCIVDGGGGFGKGVVMARNAAGLRRRSTGAVVSRVEKLRGGGSRALLEYLADDAVAVSVSEVAAGAGLAAVAYLSERGVMPMTWRGRGVAALSVAGGEASVAQVVAVLDGLDPDAVIGGAIDGAASVAAKQRKVDGYEMSFSAPKSVSALYGIGGGWVRGEIEAALAAAIGAAVEVLDDACRLTRIGSDRDRSWIETEGLLGASVLHTASRSRDPQLHVHVVLANLQRDVWGDWRAVDGNEIYDAKALAGLWFGRTLRRELTERLGLGWVTPTGGGHRELAWRSDGAEVIPPALRERWSTRSRQIDDAVAELAAQAPGMAGGDLRRAAATRSRPDKDLSEAPEARPVRWEREAEEFQGGLVESVWSRLGVEGLGALPAELTVDETVDETVDLLDAVERSLADRLNIWDTRELITTISELMPVHLGWGDATELATVFMDGSAAGLFDRGEGTVDDARRRQRRPGTATYTTQLTLQREHRLHAWWQRATRSQDALRASAEVIEAAIHRARLDPIQGDIVRGVCGDGRRAVSVAGVAGGGKTTMLRGVALAAQASGIPISAMAVKRQAAGVLGEKTGLAATSLESALRRPDKWLPAGGWWIIDEASTVSSRDWDRLRELAVSRDAKVIAVGDPRQLGSIGAGGWWAHAVALAAGEGADSATAEADLSLWRLEEPRRFETPWEKDASLRLRDGDVSVLDTYAEGGRLVDCANNADVDRRARHPRRAPNHRSPTTPTAPRRPPSRRQENAAQRPRQTPRRAPRPAQTPRTPLGNHPTVPPARPARRESPHRRRSALGRRRRQYRYPRPSRSRQRRNPPTAPPPTTQRHPGDPAAGHAALARRRHF